MQMHAESLMTHRGKQWVKDSVGYFLHASDTGQDMRGEMVHWDIAESYLWESYHEDEIDGEEPKQVSFQHFIDHNNKWTDNLKPSTEKQEVGGGSQNRQHGHHILKGKRLWTRNYNLGF